MQKGKSFRALRKILSFQGGAQEHGNFWAGRGGQEADHGPVKLWKSFEGSLYVLDVGPGSDSQYVFSHFIVLRGSFIEHELF